MTIHRYGTIIAFVLYLVSMITTVVVVLSLLDSNVFTAIFWFSLAMVLLAETALWRYVHYWIHNLNQVKRMFPGFLALGFVITAYLAAIFVYLFISGIADDLALRWHVLFHTIAFAAAIIVCGSILLFLKSTAKDEQRAQSGIIKLHDIELALKELHRKMKSHHVPQEIDSMMEKLVEKVHYSDPVTPDSNFHHDIHLLHSIQLLDEEVSWMITNEPSLSIDTIVERLDALTYRLDERNEQLLASKS